MKSCLIVASLLNMLITHIICFHDTNDFFKNKMLRGVGMADNEETKQKIKLLWFVLYYFYYTCTLSIRLLLT